MYEGTPFPTEPAVSACPPPAPYVPAVRRKRADNGREGALSAASIDVGDPSAESEAVETGPAEMAASLHRTR